MKHKRPKEYWDIINKATDHKDKLGNIAMQAFTDHFRKLSQQNNTSIDDPIENRQERSFDPRQIKHSINEDINKNFTVYEVKKLVCKLKQNKACGIDNVINEYLKNCPEQVYTLIVKLFNIVLISGIVPNDWCIGMIKPLYKKKGSMDDPDNYRGITLLSCVGKLFTACLNSRLTSYLDGVGILGEEQAGFREGYSTLDHIFVLHSLIELYLARKKRMYCAFIDYRKAFDLVDRSSLWCKLIANGINGNVIKVVYNMYENAKSCVKVNGATSELFTCNIGVRQGENLSPLLFALYLNDFEYFVSRQYKGLDMCSTEIRENLSDDDVEVFLRLYVLLYADDTIVLSESPDELQKALTAVYEYCKTWHLVVNTTKTKIVIFSRGKVRKFPSFMFGEKQLDVVEDYIYLGTTFNFNGNFNKAISKQVSQARRAMFNLVIKARKLSLPIDLQCELFDQLVVPILLYGSEIWGFQNLDQIEMFHKKFMKRLLTLRKGTANCMVYGELGRHSLNLTVAKRMVIFWAKICSGKRTKLVSTMYKLLRNLHDNGDFSSKWIVKVRNTLDNCGMSNIWYNQEVDINWLKLSIDLKLKDIAIQNWNAEVHRNRLCNNYRLFKHEFCLEEYLVQLDFVDRLNLCKFRCGNHRLPIALNRYLAENDSSPCTMCDLNEQGDEFHYIMVCPALNHLRTKYVKRYHYTRPNVLKMSNLFNSKNIKELTKLAKFIKEIITLF